MSTTDPAPPPAPSRGSAPTAEPRDATPGPSPDRAAPPPARYRARWFVFAVVLLADVMDLVDSTITNVGGPSVRADLGGGESLLQWVGAGYTLAFAVFLVTGARLGDVYGRRKLFLIGAAGFTAASAVCAAAWSPESLIVTRVLQGAFGALMIPQGFGMMKEVFDDDEMGRVFAIFGPVMGLSAVLGPLIAGGLIDLDLFGAGWRSIFLINVPIGLFVLVVAARSMPKTVLAPDAGLDLGGMALVGLASVALVFPLIEGRERGWPGWTFAMLAIGVILVAVFYRYTRSRAGRKPVLIELSLLKNASFTSGILLAMGFFASVAGIMLVISLFWQVGEGYSPSRTAVAIVPLSIGMVAGMIGSFVLVERFGRKLVQAGVVITATALAGLSFTVGGDVHPSAWSLAPWLFLAGVGMGFVFGQLFDVMLAGVDDAEVGSATGLLNALQQLSFSVGVAAVGTVFFGALDGASLPSDALAKTALFSIIPLVASFVLAFRLPPKARAEPAQCAAGCGAA